ncbi:SIS domain-containing protein [Halobacteriovorax sp. HLS]|uniref:KpsF/GutQ family sugar-phosphate isomerase n=1 Tax=Halobacteriovorax sp. HLS TaxID=2234000 RepID=UPI000FDB40DB|nr:KpsF/GutQ family sugar-phosphate isomerase [Halobacteriovorax sp. HLS]
MSKVDILKEVLLLEAKSIEIASSRLNNESVQSIEKLFGSLIESGGDLVFCGVGKSGLIGLKLAATFSSLGLRSFFLHPTEALHGDLGRLTKKDAIVFLSKSGTTEEILKIIPFLPMSKDNIVGLLGATQSEIGSHCGVFFDCSVDKEACINNQAPTTSSTVTLAMGDALAVFFEHTVNLSKEGFAKNHPGGFLGKSLRMKVADLMWKESDCAVVSADKSLKDVILEMTNKPLGACAVLDGDKFIGLIVEGDIRRTLSQEGADLSSCVDSFYNKSPISISSSTLAYDALKVMEERKNPIGVLPVIENEKFMGFLRLHDLLKAGLSSSKV